MTLFDVEWRDEYLIFPVVKCAVAVLAKVTLGLYIAAALMWLVGLVVLCTAPYEGSALFLMAVGLGELLSALAVPCLYVLALWCHQVLLAGRGMAVSRWLLLFLLFFAFLHPVCASYTLVTEQLLLVNQALLPAMLYTVLPCVFLFNRGRMAALPLRYRMLLLFFLLALLGQYILQGSFLILLMPCFSFAPLRLLARYAPQIVCLPPRETNKTAEPDK